MIPAMSDQPRPRIQFTWSGGTQGVNLHEVSVLVEALINGPPVADQLLRRIEEAVPKGGNVIALSDAEFGVLLGALLGVVDLDPESSPAILRWLLLQSAHQRPEGGLHLEPGQGDA